MLDALDPHNLPMVIPRSTLLASYVDYRTDQEQPFVTLRRMFPTHGLVSIATNGADAQMGDFEEHAMDVSEAPAWTLRQRARGIEPWAYATFSTWQQIQQVCLDAKVRPPLWFAADWTSNGVIPPGAIGVQYATIPYMYDSSVLLDFIPGFDPDPTHDPHGGGEQEDDMASSPLPVVFVSQEEGGAHVVIRWPNGETQISRDLTTTQAFRNAGATFLTVPLADMQAMINKATL